jgi:hypothetical protein
MVLKAVEINNAGKLFHARNPNSTSKKLATCYHVLTLNNIKIKRKPVFSSSNVYIEVQYPS